MLSITVFALFLVFLTGQLHFAKVDTRSSFYKAVNRVARFGEEIKAEYTLGEFYIVSTMKQRKLLRCARLCMKNSRCSFVNYIRRFHLCIFVGSKWSSQEWEKHVLRKPGSVVLVKKELLMHGWKNKDKSQDCGPHKEPQHGVFLGNMFTPRSKTIHTCETQPDRFVTYKCVSGVWSVVPKGGPTAPCCDAWKLNNSCYIYDPDIFDTMHEADEQCKATGGYLIHIETMEEQDYISDMMRYLNTDREMILIGLTDEETEGIFKWLGDASEISFRHFAPREPGGKLIENCTMLWQRDDYQWHDMPCSFNLTYICEYEL